MKRKTITIICLLLAVLLSITLFTSCGKKNEAVKTKLTSVFKSEAIDALNEMDTNQIYNIAYCNDRIYATSMKSFENENGIYVTQNTVFSINADGSDYKEILTCGGEENTYMNIFHITSAGDIWITMERYNYNEETYESSYENFIIKYNLEGEEVLRINTNNIFPELEYIYINNFKSDSHGRIYINMDTELVILNPDGTIVGTISANDNYINNLYVDTADNVYISYYSPEEEKTVMRKVDTTSMSLGEKMESRLTQYYYQIYTSARESEYDFYYNNSTALYGYKIADDSSVEICNWINSDIDPNSIGNICIIDEENIICSTYDYTNDYRNIYSKLTHVPDDQVVEKYIITYACIYTDYNICREILNFNKKNDEYKIVIKDYSEYNTGDDYTAAVTALNGDIIAGKIPDIIQIDQDLPIDSYISKGLFVDIYEYIDNDPELKREDYLTNIFDAYAVNGKLYELIYSFAVETVSAKKSVAGDIKGWNMDEFKAIIDAYPDSLPFQDMTQDQLLRNICTLTLDQFVDRNTGTCYFDSDGFKKILEYAKTLSTQSIWETIDWEEVGEDFYLDMETGYRRNTILFQTNYISSYRSYWQIMQGVYGEDIVLLGFPNDNRSGSAIHGSVSLAMSSKSPMKDGAWKFLRYFLTDEYQSTIEYNFPVKISRLNELAKIDMKPYTYLDIDGNEVEIESTYWVGNESIKIGEITQEYVDIFNDFLKSLDTVYRYDEEMYNIISEEAAAYFADAKTLDQTAVAIQNRISIYVNENR